MHTIVKATTSGQAQASIMIAMMGSKPIAPESNTKSTMLKFHPILATGSCVVDLSSHHRLHASSSTDHMPCSLYTTRLHNWTENCTAGPSALHSSEVLCSTKPSPGGNALSPVCCADTHCIHAQHSPTRLVVVNVFVCKLAGMLQRAACIPVP